MMELEDGAGGPTADMVEELDHLLRILKRNSRDSIRQLAEVRMNLPPAQPITRRVRFFT